MPATLSFPGVYIEEVSSGVRTIVGVATSVTAFVGRALRGPLNEPTFISSFGDFERTFGGLWQGSPLGHAVRAYFQNGGSQAQIVRLYHGPATGATAALSLGTGVGQLVLNAASPGAWGAGLRATADHDVTDAVALRLGVPRTDLFNLRVVDTATGAVEVHRNVTHVAGHPRNLTEVLKNESTLVRVGKLGTSRPAPTSDGVTLAEAGIAAAAATRAAATTTKEIEDADAAVKTAEAALEAARLAQAASDGDPLTAAADYLAAGLEADKRGLFALDRADLFNLLVIPPHTFDGDIEPALVSAAAGLCERRRAMLIVDAPAAWRSAKDARDNLDKLGTTSRNAAVFFPRLRISDPLRDGQLIDLAPGGAVAGIFARIDAERGVWKAPAGLEAALVGVPALTVALNDAEIGTLNPLGINCLRAAPAAGRVVWGARTRQGDDRLASEWKYIPIRRLALFIEESLFRGTQWVVFEPNDEPLWAQIRLNLGAFMHDLFRRGAFQGQSPRDAYFVKVDRETTTQSDINRGVVNIHVGFAPLKPAEFVVIKLQQIAGSLAGG